MAQALIIALLIALASGGQAIPPVSVAGTPGQAGLPVLHQAGRPVLHWFRGNLHTHTLASDGDTPPLEVAQWYQQHGYDFLVITDHDKITTVSVPGLLLVPGEEVTDRLNKTPIHVNAIGLSKVVVKRGGATAREVLQNDVDAVREAGGIALVNHPNFGWAFTAAELKQLNGASLMEIMSGHPIVNSYGGGGVPSHEQMWDEVLTSGRTIWGAAVDDSHWWKPSDDRNAPRPGKAWVVVRAESATVENIVEGLRRGDFYASTGVTLSDINGTTITIAPEKNVKYTTQFISRGGRVLATTTENPATWAIRGDEGYVRARVMDSNGHFAWTQPVMVNSK